MNNRYVALLRGINVGGHRKIRMADLRQMFRSMGLSNVDTYIQSGNVVFVASEADPSEIADKISQQIEETFGHEVPVIIRTPSELKTALLQFPFEEKEGWKGYISFLPERPPPDRLQELKSKSGSIEQFEGRGSDIYSIVNKQAAEKPLFSNSFIERQMDMPVTTRNLRTVSKIIELAAD